MAQIGNCFLRQKFNRKGVKIINNLGEKRLDVVNEAAVPGDITVQICDKVNKFLVAVPKMGHAGNKITFFDDDGAHRITNKITGEETPMYEKDGTFKFKLWMWNPSGKPVETKSGFQGQGKW